MLNRGTNPVNREGIKMPVLKSLESVSITRKLAREFLGWEENEDNFHVKHEKKKIFCKNLIKNRPLNLKFCSHLSSVIDDGGWEYNRDTIKIDPNHSVIDGQHRLLSIAISNGKQQCKSLVVRVPSHDFKTVGFCRPRTLTDEMYTDIFNEVVSIQKRKLLSKMCALSSKALYWRLNNDESAFNSSFSSETLKSFSISNLLDRYTISLVENNWKGTFYAPAILSLVFQSYGKRKANSFEKFLIQNSDFVRLDTKVGSKTKRDWEFACTIKLFKMFQSGEVPTEKIGVEVHEQDGFITVLENPALSELDIAGEWG